VRKEEFDSFKGELKQLCSALGKAYTDALGQAYWRVLHDVPLSEVEANVERILLNATEKTRFPRPGDLRTTPTAQSGMLDKGAVELCESTWKEKFRINPQQAEVDLRWHQYARIIATAPLDSPEMAMSLQATHQIEKKHGSPRFFHYR
jgi:hypothetical protein